MVMFQAFADDSGKGDPLIFVMAGFVSEASRWAEFSNEWKAVLETAPQIRYFKTKEAAALRGQFDLFDETTRRDKIDALLDVIHRNVDYGIVRAVDTRAYMECVNGKVSVTLDSPYFFVAVEFMKATLQRQYEIGKKGSVEFIFDEQHGESREIQVFWDQAMRPNVTAWMRRRMGQRPTWRDDVECVPLQAADLLAWTYRRMAEDWKAGKKFDETKIPKMMSPIRTIIDEMVVSVEGIREFVQRQMGARFETGRERSARHARRTPL
ncbi:MAG: DUF3800 domain-containing protein [Acetobacteraceae bacterium]